MESLLQMSDAAIKSNIGYFQAIRNKHATEAINALNEQRKWEAVMEMKKNPEDALKTLLSGIEI